MSNCIICTTKLKFMNTPTFGSGRLNDGGIVCSGCYKKINNINPSIARKLKNHSSADINALFQKKESDTAFKNKKLEEIKIHIKSLGLTNLSSFFSRKEINELPDIIAENERIDNIIQGIYNNSHGILVSTNRRLVFIDKGMLYGLKVEDFPLSKITSIQYETGLLLAKVKIYTSSNTAIIDNVDKDAARNFAEFVRNKLSESETQPTATTVAAPNVLEQIEKLGTLKDKGLLSQEEFNEQKIKLLEKL